MSGNGNIPARVATNVAATRPAATDFLTWVLACGLQVLEFNQETLE